MSDDNERPADAKKIPRYEFDFMARKSMFQDGPFVSSFGDGYGDPYVPNTERNVWGKTYAGDNVWAGPESQDGSVE